MSSSEQINNHKYFHRLTQLDYLELAQEFISFLSPIPWKTRNMSAGKLIYFHYDVLLCLLFSAAFFFNIHFPPPNNNILSSKHNREIHFARHFPIQKYSFIILCCAKATQWCVAVSLSCPDCVNQGGVSYCRSRFSLQRRFDVIKISCSLAISAEKQLVFFFQSSIVVKKNEAWRMKNKSNSSCEILNFHIYAFN